MYEALSCCCLGLSWVGFSISTKVVARFLQRVALVCCRRLFAFIVLGYECGGMCIRQPAVGHERGYALDCWFILTAGELTKSGNECDAWVC